MSTIELTREAFERFLQSLVERDERLEVVPRNLRSTEDEAVDEYVFSGYVEALRSESIDGDVWGTLQDLELTATTEDEAWVKIQEFYRPRGCVLLRVEADEYILGEELARRLRLI